MAEQLTPSEHFFTRVLSEHYREVEMEATFRMTLLQATRAHVLARQRVALIRLAWAGAVAALLAALFLSTPRLWRPAVVVNNSTPPPQAQTPRAVAGTQQRTTHTAAVKPPTPKVVAQAGTVRSKPTGGGKVVAPKPLPAKTDAWTVLAVQGAVTAAGQPVVMGSQVKDGLSVTTGSGAHVVLVTRRGSQVALNAGSEIALNLTGKQLSLQRGEVYCRNRRDEIASIDTAAGQIHLLGTILDAAVKKPNEVAVTVVAGKVRLANEHGSAVVEAGRQALLLASAAPEGGSPISTGTVTGWYDGRHLLSDFGDLAYLVNRDAGRGLVSEVWAMKADGTGKHRLKTFVGWVSAPGPWLPGQQLVVVNASSALWTQPDFKARRAQAGAGHPLIGSQAWLVNAATGQEKAFALPDGYDPLYTSMSPDATMLAFCGSYQPNPKSRDGVEGGVWVYSLATGAMKKMVDGWIKTPVNWSPDSRYLALSTGQDYGNNYPLVVVDVQTGKARELGVQGADARFSPDGTKLAYPGEFKEAGSWMRGVLSSGRIMIADLNTNTPPQAISPAGEGGLSPVWSPDGRRLAYYVMKREQPKEQGKRPQTASTISVVNADGTGRKEIFSGPGYLSDFTWAPSGDALYLLSREGVKVIAADGRKVLKDLGGTAKDSVLSPEAEAQTKAALDGLQEAIFQFAVGKVRSFEAKPVECQQAFKAAADGFAGLAFQYPLAELSQNQLLLYADKADELASRSAAEILADSSKERMSYLGLLLNNYSGQEKKFPADLTALEKWSLDNGWGINYISNRDTEWVKMIFRCPSGGTLSYTPPGKEPAVGDVLVSCSVHPEDNIVWTKEMSDKLQSRRRAAAGQAVETDPALKDLNQRFYDSWEQAIMGKIPFDQAEALGEEMMTKQPYLDTVSWNLGLIYARQGKWEQALKWLDPAWMNANGVKLITSTFTRGYCYDALGQREKAVANYQRIVKETSVNWLTSYAERGLKAPFWPHDLVISAGEGEARIAATAKWKATASRSDGGTEPKNAIDGNPQSPWSSGGETNGQEPGTWFQVDFDAPQTVSRVVLDHVGHDNIHYINRPLGLKATATTNGVDWAPVEVTQADLLEPATAKVDPSKPIRAIRFELTALAKSEWWTICELYVFGPKS